jgi:hypothetical protein
MMIMLTDELAQALDQQAGLPLAAVHPSTGKTFFLVSDEHYQRLRPLFEEDPLSLDEQRFQIEQMGRRAGWDDPAMDSYDQYDDHRSGSQQ